MPDEKPNDITPDHADTPPQERGSPPVEEVTDAGASEVEKGKEKGGNPLAPPINIGAGS